MKVTLYEQFKRTGIKVKKPVKIEGKLSLDKGEAFLFDLDGRALIYPLKVHDVSVFANGMMFKGIQTNQAGKYWVQEWFIPGNVLIFNPKGAI